MWLGFSVHFILHYFDEIRIMFIYNVILRLQARLWLWCRIILLLYQIRLEFKHFDKDQIATNLEEYEINNN